jgi:molybdopterin/thiamine biosynthesis adenylyltransferase
MEDITFAAPDVVEQSNLARQDYTYNQVGVNKAEALRVNVKNINPYPEFKAIPEGITDENVEELVKNADILFDGIDIRASDMMYKFHEYAAKYRKPVIVGYDLAGTAMLAVYRYDKKEMLPLNGDITPQTMEQFKMVKNAYKEGRVTEAQFLDYVNHTLSGAINPFQVLWSNLNSYYKKKEKTKTLKWEQPLFSLGHGIEHKAEKIGTEVKMSLL